MTEDTAKLAEVLVDRTRWSTDRCSLAAALKVVGTRSAMLILREAFYGTRRFDDFAVRVGVAETVAALRLRELTAAGLLRREPYREPGQRTRYQYLLTEMGSDLLPGLLALTQWGDKYLAGEEGAPLSWSHYGCGEPVHVMAACAAGHQVPLRELAVYPAKGERRTGKRRLPVSAQ